jgi:hypothetical protein
MAIVGTLGRSGPEIVRWDKDMEESVWITEMALYEFEGGNTEAHVRSSEARGWVFRLYHIRHSRLQIAY